jgi:hypothetical protein
VETLQGCGDRLYILFEYLPIPAHPRPPPVGVNGRIGFERHTLPAKLDKNAGNVSSILCVQI